MRKAPEAFRTISEAAEALDTPAHVLRFWESKFSQVKPVKRAGGRRYYRPADIDLLAGIKTLLHEQGMTIRGVQKLLQEKGARHVAALAPSAGEVLEGSTAPVLKLVPSEADAQVVPAATPAEASNDMVEEASATEGAAESETSAMAAPETATVSETKPADDPADGTDEDQAASDDAAQDTEDDVKMAADDADAELPQADTRPAPALAALLDAAADGQPKPPLRFAMIAHALRTNPPKTPNIRAETLARLVALVEKISARAD